MGLGISQRHQHLGVLETELSFPSLSNFPGHTTQLLFPYLGEMMRSTVSSSWDVSWWGALLLKNSGPQERPLPPAQVTLIQHRRGAGIQVLQIVQPPSGSEGAGDRVCTEPGKADPL